ncbi:ABC transporter ATP-binding protein [Rhodococcus triatomae]|uniref:NitT/TauT family transport system ATP-binding protein n=1 Tax=Rhodococcus triatomae TaxID=300028 RepID=A0A1G8BB53_9NOCA|nr:ABC transporter ATP-binding protein [Rhodococcus triatomae]QNG17488.1 ABC transporter ATP-binding protein [Rhodococcus triatomae]QNG22844.1 ABC transporter ATP-binding protein [Rhodococcus triatomae]SDH30263.1 NitT/TauT family transport system ATP-binding protein [Rhodococcus triatomae]
MTSTELTRTSAQLSLDGVSKSYGDNLAVRSITAEVPAGKVSVIVGPSGCGKSTLLRIISGLDSPTDGAVTFDGARVDGVPDGLAMVFQDYARSLFPWMRVDRNIAFPLRNLGKAERAARVQEAIDAVGLSGKEKLYPWQMSGGMQQRVAIARALASHPTLLLMDEPYASVDAQTRAELEDLLLQIQAKLGITVLVVTHDIDESVYLADHIIVLSTPPSVVAETIDVDLPRPRDHITTKTDPRFVEIRGHVTQLLRRAEDR